LTAGSDQDDDRPEAPDETRAPPVPTREDRRRRQAAALRDNLRKRKTQIRLRRTLPEDGGSDGGPPPA